LQTLKDIAENKNSERLSTVYAARINENFRKQTSENLKQMKSFAYLGKERITAEHFVIDPTLTEVFYYKMTLSNKIFYYHFRINKDGKIGFIVTED
jgi:hypothetical protein